MDYRKFGETYYLRFDRGDEIVSGILSICKKKNIKSAIFSGIGGCSEAEIKTFIPEKGEFESRIISGMLELVSMTGNIICDRDGNYYHHTHAAFAYKEGESHCVAAGHIGYVTVLYTGEIELRPVYGGEIKRKYSEETGTGFWDFE